MDMGSDGTDDGGGEYAAHGPRLSLARQLRVCLGIALTTARPGLLAALRGRPDEARSARRELVERLVAALRPFDVRWKGDTSDDPQAVPPKFRDPHPERDGS